MQSPVSPDGLKSSDLLDNFWSVASSAVAEFGTPLYIYFPDKARFAYGLLKDGVRAWGPAAIAFSVKTNPFFGLLRDVKTCGAYAEVVSTWEYQIALCAGFSPGEIILNGPLKSCHDLRLVIESPPITINIDSVEELDHLARITAFWDGTIPVGVRVCPPHHGETWSRFGLQLETGELGEAISRIRRHPSLEFRSVHFHLGTQVVSTDRYLEIINVAQDLWSVLEIPPDVWLDIGGGFPYEHALSIECQPFRPVEFFASLAGAWTVRPRPPLLIEPGRFIAAPSFAIVSTVLACKERLGEPAIVVLDSGTNQNVMAAFYDHLWSSPTEGAPGGQFRFCGPLCMEDDILSGPLVAPRPKPGSLVAMFNAGAYSVSLSRTFIQPRPPIVQFDREGGYHLVVPREMLEGSYALVAPKSSSGRDGSPPAYIKGSVL